MSMLIALLPLALLGALVGLDVVSFPQAMWSRPLVGATLGGSIIGRPEAGLIAGVILELLAFDTLPVGASRYPDWGTAGVVGGAMHAEHVHSAGGGALALAMIAALLTAWFGGWTMFALRKLNGSWASARRPELDAGSREAVMSLQIRGLVADLVRGALLTAGALALFDPLEGWMLGQWRLDATSTNTILVSIAAGTAAAAAWTLTHSTTRTRWYAAAGVALGVGMLAIR